MVTKRGDFRGGNVLQANRNDGRPGHDYSNLNTIHPYRMIAKIVHIPSTYVPLK